MFQTNPNNNNNNEDATRPVVARATHLAKLANYPDFTDAEKKQYRNCFFVLLLA